MAPLQAPSMALLNVMLKPTHRGVVARSSRRLTRSFHPSPVIRALKCLDAPQTRCVALSQQGISRLWEHRKQTFHLRRFSTSSYRTEGSSDSLSQQQKPPPAVSPKPGAASPFSQLSSWSRSLGAGTGQSDQAPSRTLDDYVRPFPLGGEHHIYVLSHRHNTHVTLTGPQYMDPKTNRMRQDIILTLSSGNIGYRKGQRGSFDAAYQLGSYFLSRIKNDGIAMKIQRLELVLRGFGQGREAFVKLMLGQEGATLRDRVVRVVDASRLKFGGQRAPRPRRL